MTKPKETSGRDQSQVGVAEKCPRCEGCGKIANDEDGTPWTFWATLPVQSAAAVMLGLVRPLPCPGCKGTGKAPVLP